MLRVPVQVVLLRRTDPENRIKVYINTLVA